jgi:hypothetical protein
MSSNRHDPFAGGLPTRPIPPGTRHLASHVAKDAPYGLLDLMVLRTPRQAIRRAIRESSPDLIGISARNLDAVGGPRVPAHRVRSLPPEIRIWIGMRHQES